MKQLCKMHELLKFRDTAAFNEDDIPKIETMDDFEAVEEALLDGPTKAKLVSLTLDFSTISRKQSNF